MDHLGIDRAVVGGMSQGGFLSLRAALLAPERVRALILLDTSGHAPRTRQASSSTGQMPDMWLTDGPVDELADAVANIIIADPDENQRWIAKWQARPKELMREPTALPVRARRHDRPARRDHLPGDRRPRHRGHVDLDGRAEALADGLSGRRSGGQGAGAHAANLTHPEPVNEALRSFLVDLPP